MDPRDPHLARQHPGDYLLGLRASVRGALADAAKESRDSHVEPSSESGWTPPAPRPCRWTARCGPWRLDPTWEGNLAAHAWLWKDHTGAEEAAAITATARKHAPEYLAVIGGTYSSEWFWSKIWRCLKVAPEVFEAAASWVELADYIPAVLTGARRPEEIQRCVCAAGHKAMYSRAWGGLPSKEFLNRLDPRLARAPGPAVPGGLSRPIARPGPSRREWAETLGLRAGIPVAMGGFDAHYGAVGAGDPTGALW